MMACAARALPPVEYAAFAVWWTVATLVAFSFGVFEAYLARLVVGAMTAGGDASHVTGILIGRAWFLAGILSILVLLGGPWLAGELFGGSLGATFLLPLYVILAATQAIQRGFATGQRCFTGVAGQLVADGSVRAGLAGLLVFTGRADLESMAAATCVAATVSLKVASRYSPGWFSRPRLRRENVSLRPVALLLLGSVGAVVTNSGAAPWLAAVGSENAFTIGAFAGAAMLSRIPTQLASAAFGPLLAQLSQSVEVADHVARRRLQRSADVASAAFSLLFVTLFVVAGPQVLALYLGPAYILPRATLALLALTSGLMMFVIVLQAGLAALERWGTIAGSWVIATGGLIVVLSLPFDPLVRAAAAPAAAVSMAMTCMVVARFWSTRRVLDRWVRPAMGRKQPDQQA